MLRRVPPSINYMRDEKPVIHTSRNGTVHAYVICINQLHVPRMQDSRINELLRTDVTTDDSTTIHSGISRK